MTWHPGSRCRNIPAMSLARASWTAVVVICALAAALAFATGYAGYGLTVIAVGAAAAVNLLPAPGE